MDDESSMRYDQPSPWKVADIGFHDGSFMNIFRHMRLKPSILTSFVVLPVPVFFTIIAVTYLSNDRIARANAQQLVGRFRNEAIDNIQDDFKPIKSLAPS